MATTYSKRKRKMKTKRGGYFANGGGRRPDMGGDRSKKGMKNKF